MEIWVPLISACIGGLIATIPILFGIVVQIYIHVSDNHQKRKESKTQLALELTRNEIKTIEDSIDNTLNVARIVGDIRARKELKQITEEEMWKEIDSLSNDEHSKYNQLTELDLIAEKLAYSLGGGFYEEYRGFLDENFEYMEYFTKSPTFSLDEDEKRGLQVLKRAAKLHTMLKEKLISIRDS